VKPMRTGSSELWAIADVAGIIPAPPDAELARLLASWWATGPRRFGCAAARTGTDWCVVAPDPQVWCATCAMARFADESRCIYCHLPVRHRRSNSLLFEMNGGVRILARAHRHCSEAAAKEGL
jgi:hypothetical protein